jgi:transposase, IS30 family
MAGRRRPLVGPGASPLNDKRALYIRLMKQGETNAAACRAVGVHRKTGHRWLHGRTETSRDGREKTYPSIMLPRRAISDRFLSELERVVIADGLIARHSIRSIANEIGRSPSTVSREIRRNRHPATHRYAPFGAHRRAAARRARPRARKLAKNAELRAFVSRHLDTRWSPEQICARLVRTFPDRQDMRVTPETIYQALYAGSPSGLRRDPAHSLRTGRKRRKPHRRRDRRTPWLRDTMVTIRERPAEALDRATPGHWEGDLIMGKSNRTAIGTLVERSSRYLVLLNLSEGHGCDHVRDALIRETGRLPANLMRSLAWDQGIEMRHHFEFTRATGIAVYFCDPASPWQRGSNENTNGLLRQYFPKGTDLRIGSAERLAQVAAEMNSRPRKSLNWDTPAERLAMLVASSP